MGETRVKLTLVNDFDRLRARHGLINEAEVRQADVEAVVDTGAYSLVIPESLRRQLGLDIERRRSVMLAGNVRHESADASGVMIHWGDRYSMVSPVVLEDSPEVLLGFIPLEDMDLMVDPVRQRLVGAHGDEWTRYVRRARPAGAAR
ncbi:MAG: retroviral-like aspartic protease family protein [Treponematales bacterium]